MLWLNGNQTSDQGAQRLTEALKVNKVESNHLLSVVVNECVLIDDFISFIYICKSKEVMFIE